MLEPENTALTRTRGGGRIKGWKYNVFRYTLLLSLFPDAMTMSETGDALMKEKLVDENNYEIIEQKLLAARVSEGMEEDKKGESFQVIEPAFLPQRPAEPNRTAIILIGAVLAFALAACVVAAREFLDNRIYDLEVLQKASGFPVISIIPSIMTEVEIAAIRKRRVSVRIAAVTVAVLVILAFHLFVMDFNIVYAKLGRLVQRTIP